MSNHIKGKLRKSFWYGGDDSDTNIASLSAFCPACDFEHSFNVDFGHGKQQRAVWTFNGDYDNPTFSPSMLSNPGQQYYEHHPQCHSFLRDGQWQYLNDCTHAMAGQTVEVPYPDPDMTFQRRHGWHLFPWTDDEGNPIREDE